jgi:hypothetical protein
MRAEELSWKPVRSGKYYCSPACGGGKYCLHSDYLRARKAAARLCAKLGPHYWKPVVTENLGWHYSAVLETLEVHASAISPLYTCFYNGPHQFIGYDNDPRKAVVKAFALAQKDVNQQLASNEAIRKALLKQPRLSLPPRIKEASHGR